MKRETIDLEKEMIAGNQSISKQQQLVLDEYQKIKSTGNDVMNALTSVGLSHNIIEGQKIETSMSHLSRYTQSRIFHKDQIKKICMKYDLRFLNAKFYKGPIDEQLGGRILQFQEHYQYKGTLLDNKNISKEDCYFIVAPKESFDLTEKPLDPLFFARLDENYYYLIHKWGKDLSGWRRFHAILNTFRYGIGGSLAPLGLIPMMVLIVAGLFLIGEIRWGIFNAPNPFCSRDGNNIMIINFLKFGIPLIIPIAWLVGRGIKSGNYQSEYK